jgi:hypothetical protein
MFCRYCASEERADAVFCSKCGSRIAEEKDIAEQAENFDTTIGLPPLEAKPKPKRALFAIAAIAVVAVLGIAIGSQFNQTTEEAYVPTDSSLIEEEPVIDKSWVPAGYDWQNDEFAVKWVTDEGDWPCDNCNFWKLKVVPHYDCNRGVYAELNMLDYAETVVDWTNDSLPSLSAGQTGLLIFENYPYDEGIDAGQLTELTCHM